LNVRVIENMIMVGVFDEFGLTRKTLIDNLKSVQSFVAMENQKGEHVFRFLESPEFPFEQLMAAEKDLLGIHLKHHPMTRYEALAKTKNYVMAGDVEMAKEGKAEVLGVLSRIKTLKTKRGDTMAFLEIEDAFGRVEAVVFPEDYQRCQDDLKVNEVAVFRGTIALRNEAKQLVVDRVIRLKEESL
jgi:DNA polymerase-3 subunit alpha